MAVPSTQVLRLLLCIVLYFYLTNAISLATEQLRQKLHKRSPVKPLNEHVTDPSSFRFKSSSTAPYAVQSLPLIDFDVGELYAGTIPVDETNPDSAMFFIFQSTIGEPVDEITIWLQGGPGCSSLEGFLQENGLWTWQWGQYNAAFNPYSWVSLTNVLWVEYPLGVGYSANYAPSANTEEEISQDFLRFFKNFQKTFGISKFKIYVTGESYAGFYVPYIADAMLKENDTDHFDVAGALMYNPTLGPIHYVQHDVAITPFVQKNKQYLNLNESYLSQLVDLHEKCGYKGYISDWYKFPPAGLQPAGLEESSPGGGELDCQLWLSAYQAAYQPNPCFSPYAINLQCPLLFDPLGFPTDLIYLYPGFGENSYFDRDDVKEALHAPNVTWALCNGQAFNKTAHPEVQYGDISADSIQGPLPQVIDATQRVLIAGSDLDFQVPTLGIMLAIQNMTWGGELGFQSEPSEEIVITLPDLQYNDLFVENGFEGFDGPGQGYMGTQHFERGLMWAETRNCGHMQPQLQPRSSYRHLQWLLGKIDKL